MAEVFRPPVITRIPRPDPAGVAVRAGMESRSDVLLTTLASQDALPFRQLDWPNPRVPRYPTKLRTTLDWFTLPFLFEAQPFNQHEWTNPPGPVFPVSLRTWADPLKLPLLGADFLPSRLMEWPNPTPPAYAVSLRTWFDTLKINLLGQDRIYGDAGQVPSYDWRNPAGPIYPVSLRSLLSPGFLEEPPPPPVVVPVTTGRRQKGQRLTRAEREAQYKQWSGQTQPEVVTPDAIPEKAPAAPPALSIEVFGVTRFCLKPSATVTVDVSLESRSRLTLSPKAKVSIEKTHRGTPITFTMIADRSKVISETVHSGGGGFKFGVKHRVDTDLWIDRPISPEEEAAIMRKLKP